MPDLAAQITSRGGEVLASFPPDPLAGFGAAYVVHGNARSIPLPDNSVDLIVTSPPYFALRSYQDAGEHYEAQIGAEPTPAEYVDSLIAVTRECVRVLKPSGSLWVNLGDKYAQSAAQWGGSRRGHQGILAGSSADEATQFGVPLASGAPSMGNVKPKSLIGIPWRYALRCIDDLGLILRAEMIWAKSNGLPESVRDRVRRSHEQWFYFEQSRGEVVESGAQRLPLCSLCGRPADPRATLVARLHELDPGIENSDLPNEMGSDQRVQGEDGLSAEKPGVVGPSGSPVPLAVPGDPDPIEDSAHLLDDAQVAVVDQDAKVRAPHTAVTESDTALSVDDPGEPSEVCRCGHPFIVGGEPWIPQTLAAELMQMVADGEADAQHVADFLSGDYARTHSTWFHFTAEPRYYASIDEIREPHIYGKPNGAAPPKRGSAEWQASTGQTMHGGLLGSASPVNPLGKLPGSVRTVATEPLNVPDHIAHALCCAGKPRRDGAGKITCEDGIDHYAAYPSAWPKFFIEGWAPRDVCTVCGQGREPVAVQSNDAYAALRREVSEDRKRTDRETHLGRNQSNSGGAGAAIGNRVERPEYAITGYACACPEPTAPSTPGVVLDVFGGTGTTAMVARALGYTGISLDASRDYGRVIAAWRVGDSDGMYKVRGVAKPDPVKTGKHPDQLGLFDGLFGD